MSNKTVNKFISKVDRIFEWDYRNGSYWRDRDRDISISIHKCSLGIHFSVFKNGEYTLSKYCKTFADIRECISIVKLL